MANDYTLDGPFDGFTLTDALRQMEVAFRYERPQSPDTQPASATVGDKKNNGKAAA